MDTQIEHSEIRRSTMRRVAPAIGLFLLAPIVAEALLGNVAVNELPLLLPLLGPLYGAAAVLIREVARRTGRGMPTMIVLGVAYGLFEEGLVTQMLFNPSYAGNNLMEGTYISQLGMGAWLTIAVLALHAIWSTNAGIVVIETLIPDRSTEPWLRTPGLVVTSLIFIFGSIFVAFGIHSEERFLASPTQLVLTALTIGALVVLAFKLPHIRPLKSPSPRPVLLFVGAIGFGLLLTMSETVPGWWSVLIAASVAVLAAVTITRWSICNGWGTRHRFALAYGALWCYGVGAFFTGPEGVDKGVAEYVLNIVMALALMGLGWLVRRQIFAKHKVTANTCEMPSLLL